MNLSPHPHPFISQWPQIAKIDGWLDRESAALMDGLIAGQDELGLPGRGILEIGVWRGRSATLLARHLRESEDLLLVDAWLQQQEIVKSLSSVMGNRLQQHPINLFQGTARELSSTLPKDKRFRYIHIDGDHTGAGLRTDLLLAQQVMEPTGLIVLDDIFNYLYPQLIREMFLFLAQEGRDLACILIGFNKACLCRTASLDMYGDWIFNRINDVMLQRGVPVTLCRTTNRVEWPGYSLVADIGMPRRGLDGKNDYIRP